MIPLSDEDQKAVFFSLKKHRGDYEEVAKELRIPMRLVECVDVIWNKKFNYTPEGMGRPELQKYIVGVRDLSLFEGWDNTSLEIKIARQQYANGTVELCTARDGMKAILYSIPRIEPIQRSCNVLKLQPEDKRKK